jgi:predicted RNase H-like nuclease
VPVGLPYLGGSRPCDTAARKRLGKQHPSGFTPPGRFLVERFDRGEEQVPRDAGGRDGRGLLMRMVV